MPQINQLILDKKYDVALKELLLLENRYLEKFQCLYELHNHEQLIQFFDATSAKIEDEYYEILGYYVLSLIELNEFDKALTCLNEELSMPYIEQTFLDVLNMLYDNVVAKKQMYLIESGIYDKKITEEDASIILEQETDYNELLSLIMKLDEFNIRKLLDSIDKFLQADQSPVLKTFILETLIKQQVSQSLLVNKNNLEYEFVPIANQLVFENVNYLKTKHLLEDHLAKTPSFLEMALDILDLYVYIIFPNEIDIDEVNFMAAMIEYYVYSLNSEDLLYDFETFYEINLNHVIDNVELLSDSLTLEEKFSLNL